MVLKNPFADYGGVITGNRFVGRDREIELIQTRLLGEAFGNLAIMGLPRIGKSSLAWNSIMVRKKEIAQKNVLPIWLSFGEFTSLFECLEEIFIETIENIMPLADESATFETIHKQFSDANTPLEKRRYAKKFFKGIKKAGFRLIVILDEFDNAKNILSLQDFQFLREISYNLETKIGILTISRNTIQEIEPDEGALSNFYQIFTDLNLQFFSKADLNTYWDRISHHGVDISQDYKDKVDELVGQHPFLLDVLNYEVFNNMNQSGINVDLILENAINDLHLKLFNEFESIIKLMKYEHLDRMMMQMIVGPVYDITQREIEKLLKFGIVTPGYSGDYRTFSTFFNQYLHNKSSEIDIWPLWSEVETEVRNLIKGQLSEKYGEDWEGGYRKEFDKKAVSLFDGGSSGSGLIGMRNKNKKTFGDLASDHLVDYTYPMQMFDSFIIKDWSWYGKVFGKQPNDWKPLFEHLGKIRNPLAHNNPNFLSNSDKSIADGYCSKLLDVINQWKSLK